MQENEVMDWTQFIIFFISVFGLFIWNRSESRSDIRYMDAKLESNRDLVRTIHQESREKLDENRELIRTIQQESREKLEENRELVRTIHQESMEMIRAIQLEIRDFHAKLYSLEEKNKTERKG